MAGKPAPDTPLSAVRNVETDEVTFVLPIDAREFVASGAYVLAPDVAVPQGSSVLPRAAHQQRLASVRFIGAGDRHGDVREAHAIDAKELVASGEYEYVGDAPNLQVGAEVKEASGLVEIDLLEKVLGTIEDADELLEMEAKDSREEAKPYYEARFNELAKLPPRI